MRAAAAMRDWLARWGLEILGWLLIPIGIILWPLPGPGLLIIASGIALLSRRHAWAQRVREPIERNAIRAAKFGVATWPRIGVSVLGCVWLVVLGWIWYSSPEIPEFDVLGVGFGPQLPAAGWGTALGIWVSAVAAFGLLVFSIVKWREPRVRTT